MDNHQFQLDTSSFSFQIPNNKFRTLSINNFCDLPIMKIKLFLTKIIFEMCFQIFIGKRIGYQKNLQDIAKFDFIEDIGIYIRNS